MSRRKEENKNEYEIIQEQFLNFRRLEQRIGVINIVNDYHEKEMEIGETTERIRYHTYAEVFNNMLANDEYTILLIDDSMINMQYIFDKNQQLVKHTLSFLPNYQRDIYVLEEETITKEDANINSEDFSRRLNNYIRIDYDEIGREEYYHSLVHLHLGVFKQNIRFPLQGIMYPNEFLFLILKYIYKVDDDTLTVLNCDIQKENLLTDNEKSKLRLLFGN